MTTLTAARRQILDGLLAELAADERVIGVERTDIESVRLCNQRMAELDAAAEPDPCDDDAEIAAALWDESGNRP